jgi:hypothetical protein
MESHLCKKHRGGPVDRDRTGTSPGLPLFFAIFVDL